MVKPIKSMFKNYSSTCKAIFLSHASLYFFVVAAASAVRWLRLQNTSCLTQKSMLFGQKNNI
jgi:hypothetical protein